MDFEKMAESFDALKRKQRIKTMFFAVEENKSVKEIADEIEMSESTVRTYLKDLEAADFIEKKGGDYEYTEYGERLKSSLEVMVESENLKWLKKEQSRAENLRTELKAQRKKIIKKKITDLL